MFSANPPRLAVLLLVLVLALGACSEAPPPTSSPAAPTAPLLPSPTAPPPTTAPTPTQTHPVIRVLRVAETAPITTWNPVTAFSTEAAYLANIYETLLRLNPPGAPERFTPLLAERWEHNAAGTVWTFHLRPGVVFHDGEPLTAQAVVASIAAIRHQGPAAFAWSAVDHITADDAHTVTFYLKHPAPLDVIAAAPYGAWIVSPKMLQAAATDPDYFDRAAAAGQDGGTGPYTLAAYTPHSQLTLQRFADYWRGWQADQFATIQIALLPHADDALQRLAAGQVDLSIPLPPARAADFAADPAFRVVRAPTFFNYIAFFNTLHPPLDDVRVRQALSYATPYAEIIATAVHGLGNPSHGPVPQGLWPGSADVPHYTHDLAQARTLLAQAGYEHGFDRPLQLTYAAENPLEAAIAEQIRKAYAQIGVQVTPTPMSWNRQWEYARADPASPDTQDIFLMVYWPPYGDGGQNNLWALFHSSRRPFLNLSYWQDPAFDRLLEQAVAETVTAPTQAQQHYRDLMNMLVDQAPALFLCDAVAAFALPPTIHGFVYNPYYPFVPYDFYALTAGE